MQAEHQSLAEVPVRSIFAFPGVELGGLPISIHTHMLCNPLYIYNDGPKLRMTFVPFRFGKNPPQNHFWYVLAIKHRSCAGNILSMPQKWRILSSRGVLNNKSYKFFSGPNNLEAVQIFQHFGMQHGSTTIICKKRATGAVDFGMRLGKIALFFQMQNFAR